jgi:hypothetical protein
MSLLGLRLRGGGAEKRGRTIKSPDRGAAQSGGLDARARLGKWAPSLGAPVAPAAYSRGNLGWRSTPCCVSQKEQKREIDREER